MQKFSKVSGGDKNKPIVVICRTGQRSKLVAGILDREGYKNVYNYKEGIIGWLTEKKPVVRIR
jgi:rhodanese-related sulfurtransferase